MAAHCGTGELSSAPAGGVSGSAELRTQDRVRAAVAAHGPISATGLATRLGLTAAGVRRHLDNLTELGVIEIKRMRPPGAGAGRPSRHYVLSAAGQQDLGDDYLGIANLALRQLRSYNDDAVEELARERYRDFESRVADSIARLGREGLDSVQARSHILSRELDQEGFVSSVSQLGKGVTLALQLCQGHCPIQGLAEEYPEFCEQEAAMFSRLLGVDVRRLSTLVSGSHVCTTHIPLTRDDAMASQGDVRDAGQPRKGVRP